MPPLRSSGVGCSCGGGEECCGLSPQECSISYAIDGVAPRWIYSPPATMRRRKFLSRPFRRTGFRMPSRFVGPVEAPVRISSVQTSEIPSTASRATQCSADSDLGVSVVGEEAVVSPPSQPLAVDGSGAGLSPREAQRSDASAPGSPSLSSEPGHSQLARGPTIRTALDSRGWSAGSIDIVQCALSLFRQGFFD